MNPHDNKKTNGTPCSLFRRLLIMLYDGVIIVALLMLATAFAMLAGTGNHTAMQDPLYTAYLVLVWFAYLAWCWHTGGMTLGMRAWHVCITDETGRRPGLGKVCNQVPDINSLCSTGRPGIPLVVDRLR